MKKTVAILGGYGVFGAKIAQALSADGAIHLVIAGHDQHKAKNFARLVGADSCAIDIRNGVNALLRDFKPDLVVNCCGPFQQLDYAVATACIEQGAHYIDLADARDYVANFASLHDLALQHNVAAITGASTVPAISSAIVDYFQETDFAEIHMLDYGISPGNQTPRGVATVAAILFYVGRPFATLIDGRMQTVYGWQNLHREHYPVFGARWLGNCDVPDLALFKGRYPTLRTIRFYAGLELSILHLGLWVLSWVVRGKLLMHLAKHAALLRRVSLWLYPFGHDTGGMYMRLRGLAKEGRPLEKNWYIIAESGDGPHIPVTPAIILVKKILSGLLPVGAYPALGVITRDELFAVLRGYKIQEIIT